MCASIYDKYVWFSVRRLQESVNHETPEINFANSSLLASEVYTPLETNSAQMSHNRRFLYSSGIDSSTLLVDLPSNAFSANQDLAVDLLSVRGQLV